MNESPARYMLLDSCLLAGYYAPKTLEDRYPKAAERIRILVDSVRNGGSPHVRLLTPEVCVSEAQTVLSKHANSGWSRKRKTIHGKSFKSLRTKMREDLHGGNLIESIPLQRYHVLAKHFVSAIDHSLHLRQRDSTQPVAPLSGMDQLIAGVSVWLCRFLGQSRLILVSTDYRLVKVLEKCRKLKREKAEKLGLYDIAKDIGIQWSPSLYPEPIHLGTASDRTLQRVLGSWPLSTKPVRQPVSKPKRVPTESHINRLVELSRALGVGRDRLPYSDEMTTLTTTFNRETGYAFSERDIWNTLLIRLKKGIGVRARKNAASIPHKIG
jgi:hypothetical protein